MVHKIRVDNLSITLKTKDHLTQRTIGKKNNRIMLQWRTRSMKSAIIVIFKKKTAFTRLFFCNAGCFHTCTRTKKKHGSE